MQHFVLAFAKEEMKAEVSWQVENENDDRLKVTAKADRASH